MQCLSSPTRQNIDKVHARKEWLDVGVSSVRNLKRISRKRIVFWGLLAITSLLLHLMYNSAVFDTLFIYRYDAFIVSKDFSSEASFNAKNLMNFNDFTSLNNPDLVLLDSKPLAFQWIDFLKSELDAFRISSSDVQLKNLTTKDCILAYGNVFEHSNYKNVLTVSSVNKSNNSLLGIRGNLYLNNHLEKGQERYLWCCEDHDYFEYCNVNDAANHAHDMTVGEYSINYCIVQEIDNECMLQFSLPIMFVVIICNLTKTACMICVVLGEISRFLIIVDDAIAFFLREPDPHTKNVCLADKNIFRKEGWQ